MTVTLSQMVSEEEKARFNEAGNHPIAWVYIGDNLFLAAQRLETDFVAGLDPDASSYQSVIARRLQGAVLMLRGAAVECLLKAIIVQQGKPLAVDGRFESPGGPSHDLKHLASLTSLAFSESELWMLYYLGFWINQGRYPIPIRASDRDIKQRGLPLESNWNAEHEASYVDLRRRLKSEVLNRTGYQMLREP